MKKLFLIISVVVIAIVVWFVVNLFAGGTNNALNKAFNSIDYSCNVDSDCVKKGTDCNVICGSKCVNKNWKLVCLFPEQKIFCTIVEQPHMICKCIDNICVKYDESTNQTTDTIQ